MRRFLLIPILLVGAASGGASLSALTDLKAITLDPSYRHDRFDTQPKDIIKEFRAYTTSFDSCDDNDGDGIGDNWGIPEWVAYEMRKAPSDLGKAPDRPSPWITDAVLHEQQIAPNDKSYTSSGYSRGHMCMKSHAWRLGANADWNTHTVLNACPQKQRMNAGVWLGLENATADWADKYDVVWIICGPIVFNDKTPSEWIGDPGEVKAAVPDAFYKIVVKDAANDGLDVLAFIFPMYGDDDYGSTKADLTSYLTSVDTIEALTGLDFLSNVNADVESQVERIVHTELWPTGD